MALYGFTVFLSAFLLFLIQPLIGKLILPWFGGSPGVWTTCMLFFQVLLLAGYSYAHLVATRLSARRQALVHTLFLCLTFIALPITPAETWKPLGSASPTWNILALLTYSVGLPYFLLSSMGPLLQSWFSRVDHETSPYRLYSLSNAGSLLAVLSYPFLIEPSIGVERQSALWSILYLAFVFSSVWIAVRLFRAPLNIPAPDESSGTIRNGSTEPSFWDRALWILLPACGSLVLLATTNQICQDVAVIPLLWIVPLALYLLTFIFCFHSERWYSRLLFGIALAICAGVVCWVMYKGVFVSLKIQLASYCATLFVTCMICHGEMVRLKPGSRHLTSFYLSISAGGAAGGIFVTIFAPLLFQGYWELHLSLVLSCAFFFVCLFRDRKCALYQGNLAWLWTPMYFGIATLVVVLGFQIHESLHGNIDVHRNFFGVLRVTEQYEEDPYERRYTLMHGRIEHGFQLTDPEKRYWPTSYFGPDSGVGLAIRYHPNRRGNPGGLGHMRIGVVGLGTGTLAAYGEQGDWMEFYEVNPEVVQLCDRFFTYRSSSQASIQVALGDARISMERQKQQQESQQFDLLAVDAFAGDAIPVHLLTRECYEVYSYHLKPDGILAVHVSNRYFDLKPVVRGLGALDPDKRTIALWIDGVGSERQETDSSDWVLLTRNEQFLARKGVRDAVREWTDADPAPVLWTDDYTNLFGRMRK